MSSHDAHFRFAAHARIEIPECELLPDGRQLQLVRLALTNDGPVIAVNGEEVDQPEVICPLRPQEARELAHALLALADQATTISNPSGRPR
jgi:hypothetical protein